MSETPLHEPVPNNNAPGELSGENPPYGSTDPHGAHTQGGRDDYLERQQDAMEAAEAMSEDEREAALTKILDRDGDQPLSLIEQELVAQAYNLPSYNVFYPDDSVPTLNSLLRDAATVKRLRRDAEYGADVQEEEPTLAEEFVKRRVAIHEIETSNRIKADQRTPESPEVTGKQSDDAEEDERAEHTFSDEELQAARDFLAEVHMSDVPHDSTADIQLSDLRFSTTEESKETIKRVASLLADIKQWYGEAKEQGKILSDLDIIDHQYRLAATEAALPAEERTDQLEKFELLWLLVGNTGSQYGKSRLLMHMGLEPTKLS